MSKNLKKLLQKNWCRRTQFQLQTVPAIQLALLTLGVGQGDEVIVPSLTFAAVYNAVIFSGAKPVMIDINLETLGLNHRLIEKNN